MKRRLHRPLIYIIACYGLEILPCSAQTQEAQELAPVKVEGRPYGEEIIGPYNQPRWSARGRFSADTDVYVVPAYAFYLDLDYHGTFPRVGKSDHLFTQEVELGRPLIGVKPLVDDSHFKNLLVCAAKEDPLTKEAQDEFFDKAYWTPAFKCSPSRSSSCRCQC